MQKQKNKRDMRQGIADNSGEVRLGMIRTLAVGLQYYDARLEPGMEVVLEREPANSHDANAIRVDTSDFQRAGHLPRRTAAWLAPLIDAGKIRADGRIAASSEIQETSAPLDLSLHVAPKGKAILERNRQPASGREAVHQMVLALYLESAAWEDMRPLRELLPLVEPLQRSELLPETRMLLELLPARAGEIARKMAARQAEGLVDALKAVRIGQGLHYHNLTVFPLFQANGHDRGYLLLDAALRDGLAQVTEVSDSGHVPELRLVNRAPQPILIPEGEIVVGGKQNRTINITILVPAGAEFTLPVSCVEHGRWHRLSDRFEAGFHAPPSLRANKIRSVRESRERGGSYESDQGRVWEDVDCCLSAARATSETASLTDGYAQAAGRLAEYREHLPLPPDATGILVFHGEEVIGLDLFDHAQTMASLWPRLSEAYFLAHAGGDAASPADAGLARAFLDRLAGGPVPANETPGLGQAFDIAGENVVGSALWYDGHACHVAAFADTAEQNTSSLCSRRTRNSRRTL